VTNLRLRSPEEQQHEAQGTTIDPWCWMTRRSICLVKQVSLLEVASTVVLLATVVADLSGVFHVVDSAALQVTHRCTPAPDGMLGAPAALPSHSFGDVDHLVLQIFALCVGCRLVPQ